MLITTFKSTDPIGRSLVDAYQLYQAESPLLLKTLPNGRVNAWITLEGTFYMELPHPNQWMRMPEAGFFSDDFRSRHLTNQRSAEGNFN